MVFAERKIEAGYEYDSEDLYGAVHLESPEKLPPETLDDIVLYLAKGPKAALVEGDLITAEGVKVTYAFRPADQWEEEEEEEEEKEPCENTPT